MFAMLAKSIERHREELNGQRGPLHGQRRVLRMGKEWPRARQEGRLAMLVEVGRGCRGTWQMGKERLPQQSQLPSLQTLQTSLISHLHVPLSQLAI